MNWREKLGEQSWVIPLLPNYMKPLDEPALINEQTKEFIYEAEEFISDLAALSELPRINKTFKRNIQGYSYKIKIKPKKIHLEMADTSKSSSRLKKKIYITTFRKNIKMEKGFGKIIDSTIYYQYKGKTVVRNVRKHPFFQSLFHHIHRLDLSLSGEPLPKSTPAFDQGRNEQQLSPSSSETEQKSALIGSAEHTKRQYNELDRKSGSKLEELLKHLHRCMEEYHLLDLEEKHHLKRMIQHDLPNLLHAYESLNDSQQLEKFEEVKRTLVNMAAYLEKQADNLKATRLDRINHLIKLNELRYKENPNSAKLK